MAAESSTERRQIAWIGQGVTIEGRIASQQDIRIDGQVNGTIEVGQHELVLGAGSEVRANLRARSVIVAGTVLGNVTATERLQIEATGSIDGDVTAPLLTIVDGGSVRGKADIAGTGRR